jgi:hypothetical protein
MTISEMVQITGASRSALWRWSTKPQKSKSLPKSAEQLRLFDISSAANKSTPNDHGELTVCLGGFRLTVSHYK